MEGQEQCGQIRVVKIESMESWNFYLTKATHQDSLEVAAKLEIKAMPTFLVMKNGTQIDKLVGANPEEIRKRISAYFEAIHVA